MNNEYRTDPQLESALNDDDPDEIIKIFHYHWGSQIIESVHWDYDRNIKLDAWTETLTSLYKYLPGGRTEIPLKGLELYKLALTIFQRRLWRLWAKHNRKNHEPYQDSITAGEPHDIPDAVLDEDAFIQDALVQLGTLSDRQFEVIRYRSESPDATYDEIAEALSRSTKSVESSLRQAREKLKPLRERWPPEYFKKWLGAIAYELERRNQ